MTMPPLIESQFDRLPDYAKRYIYHLQRVIHAQKAVLEGEKDGYSGRTLIVYHEGGLTRAINDDDIVRFHVRGDGSYLEVGRGDLLDTVRVRGVFNGVIGGVAVFPEVSNCVSVGVRSIGR